MRIATIATAAILLLGTAACNNPKPAETPTIAADTSTMAAPALSDATNGVVETTITTNAVDAMAPVSNGAVASVAPAATPPVDEPKANPDRK